MAGKLVSLGDAEKGLLGGEVAGMTLPETIIVMLVWVGTSSGGPAVIQGFQNMAACEMAAKMMMTEKVWNGQIINTPSTGTKCVEMKAR